MLKMAAKFFFCLLLRDQRGLGTTAPGNKEPVEVV